MDAWIYRLMDGCMHGCMHAFMDGCMEVLISSVHIRPALVLLPAALSTTTPVAVVISVCAISYYMII